VTSSFSRRAELHEVSWLSALLLGSWRQQIPLKLNTEKVDLEGTLCTCFWEVGRLGGIWFESEPYYCD
jgi:hypothetical protein